MKTKRVGIISTIIFIAFRWQIVFAQIWTGNVIEFSHNALGDNSDYTAIYRADAINDRAVLRVMMGDEYTSDFQIGYTNYQTGQWHTTFNLDGNGNGFFQGWLGIGNTSPESYLHIGTSNLGWGKSVRMILEPPQHTGAGWEFSVRDDPNKSFLGIGYGTEQFVMDHNGNVGIGTTAPDAKLAVKGTVHANEVKVDLNGAVAPDYVFNSDYNLLSLEEIKTYIDQHKHLPEVPSAKEMEANGVQLGEMNMLLLKKIEELTLHIIELEKRVKTIEIKE
jgi:hypothetical protein